MAETLDSVERSLETLLLFNADRHEIGVTELATLLGCSTSSAQRTIHTLTKLKFLRRDDQRRVYRLGSSVLHLSRSWQSTASLASITKPVVAELAEATGLMSLFAVADQAHMRVVVSVDGVDGPLREYPIVGELYPAHVGATAKAYFAYLSQPMREHFTSQRPLARYTSVTSMDMQELEGEFARIREMGYCVTQGEYDEQVTTLAVPVKLKQSPLGTVSVSTRNTLQVTDALIAHIREATRQIGQLLAKHN